MRPVPIMPAKKVLRNIAVEGPIGVGKTTLVKMLAEELGGQPLLEPLEKNCFLADFYKDPSRHAFKTQLFFLLSRYQQQLELKQPPTPKLVICDYTFVKDSIFAKINLGADEQSLYQTVFQLLQEKLPKPDLVIYLMADSKVLMQRIKKRNFSYEKPITQSYLKQLTNAYNEYFLNYNETPLLVVDTSTTDYQNNPEDFSNLKREILNHPGGTVHLIAR